MKKKHLAITLLLMICFFKAQATDYYINPTNGNDSENGLTASTAFKSLNKIEALNLQPGDTVFFMKGTYTNPGQTLLQINKSGTANNWITFKNYPNHKPIFEFDSWTCIDVIGGSSYLNFEGLTIKGARSKVNVQDALNQGASCENKFQGNPEGLYNGTGILVVGPNLTWSNNATTTVPHHINVNNCEIYDCTSSGVAFQQADYVTITNNKIYNNCWYTIYGTSGINLYQLVNTDDTKTFHNEITNNLIYGNQLVVPQVPHCAFYDGNGFIIDDFNHTQTKNYKDPSAGYSAYTAKTLIANNISVENGGSGLHFFLSSNCYILNNTIANNAFQNEGSNGNGDLRIGGCSDFVIKNNVIKGENSVHRNGNNTNIEYTHNYQYGPGIESSISDCEGCINDTDITFLNTDITNSQPYITDFSDILTDAGITLDEVNNDYLFQARAFGNTYDIGAYELTGNSEPCELTTWYADTDSDGFGNENDTTLACEKPDGYVANNSDLCPTDILKAVPGECGCDIEEDTCNDNTTDETNTGNDICDTNIYDINTAYSTTGTTVIYNGNVYTNNWYASGLLPTNGGPWQLIGFCDTTPENCSEIPGWLSSNVYTSSGNQVVYNGLVYENKWHISGETPENTNAWELIGYCNSASKNSTTAPLKSNIYTSNDTFEILIYNLGGQVLLNKKVSYSEIDNTKNLLKASTGIYIVHITNINTGISEVRKIIK